MFIPTKYDESLRKIISRRYENALKSQREWDQKRQLWGWLGWAGRGFPVNPHKERASRLGQLYMTWMGLKIGDTVYLSHEEYVELRCTINADDIAANAIIASKINAGAIDTDTIKPAKVENKNVFGESLHADVSAIARQIVSEEVEKKIHGYGENDARPVR